MSKEYPCVYFEKDGVCRKLSSDTDFQYCVMGPCPGQALSNADRIRAMSDEELAERIWSKFGCPNGKNHVTCGYVGDCKDCWMEWLQQPAKEDT